ncbi:hypothetical protein AAF712_015072, partial [Marasmius tenuissimus]
RGAAFPAFCDLSIPKNLEHLVISIRNIVQDELDELLLDIIRNALNTLASPKLQHIAFNVNGSGFKVLSDQWDALDSLLAAPKFATAQVELVIPFSDSTLANEDDLVPARKLFQRCSSQGRLSVIRVPFVVKTRTWMEDPNEEKQFEDHDAIDWVCRRFSA